MFKGSKNDVFKCTFSNQYKNLFKQKTPIGQPYIIDLF